MPTSGSIRLVRPRPECGRNQCRSEPEKLQDAFEALRFGEFGAYGFVGVGFKAQGLGFRGPGSRVQMPSKS